MKQIINQLFQEKYKNDPNSQDLSRVLNSWIDSTFAAQDRIFYELLQNADDAAVDQDLAFKVFLLKDYLVFNYNGKPFDEADLQSLCSVAASSKSTQSHKIGYKGIGFKSVFKITDCAWIQSEENCFRFDKDYKNQAAEHYPWQIIPIWTEPNQLPQEILELQDQLKGKVSIILKLNHQKVEYKKLRKRLNAVYGKHQIILFLRSVKAISCYTLVDGQNLGLTQKVVRKDEDSNGIRSLELIKPNAIIKTQQEQYLAKEFVLEIPPHIQSILESYSSKVCPEKLKTAKAVQLTLAAPIDEEEQILATGMSDLYCFLPTKIKKKLPFIVNAEFLTDAERTKLLYNNEWNDFLFEQIARTMCHWLQEIVQQSAFKYQIPKLIRLKYSSTNKQDKNFSLYRAFNRGLEDELSKVAFLPEYESEELALVQDSVIDETHYSFQEDFDLEDVKTQLQSSYSISSPKILDPALEDLEKIIGLGAKSFNMELMKEMLDSKAYQNKATPIKNLALIEFLSQAIDQLPSKREEDLWNKTLSETHILLTEVGNFRTAAEVYFPIEAQYQEDCIFQLSIPLEYLHSSLHTKSSKNAKLWLSRIGVKKARPLEIIDQTILPLLKDPNLSNPEYIQITRCIFHHRDLLGDEDYKNLRKSLKILTTQHQLKTSWETYLADLYEPELKIEAIAKNTDFVSEDYPENSKDKLELQAWRNFFIKLKVQEKMKLQVWETPLHRKQLIDLQNTEDYLAFLARKYKSNNFSLHHFSRLSLLENLHSEAYDFALTFWELLLDDGQLWFKIQQYSAKQKMELDGQKKKTVLSHFQYYVQHKDCFPTSSGTCLPTTQIYSKEYEFLLKDSKAISFIDLSHADANFLGIRTELSLAELLDLLEDISKSEVNEEQLKRIQEVYMLLQAYHYQKLNPQELQLLNSRKKQLPLLASDMSFQPAANLHYFQLSNFSPPKASSYFIYTFTDYPKLMKTVYELFDIPKLEEKDLEVDAEDEEEDHSLKKLIQERLKAISFVCKKRFAYDLKEKEHSMLEQLECLTVVATKGLALDFKQGVYRTVLDAYLIDHKLYYRENWRFAEVLYAICPLLCKYFDLGAMERELQLILELHSKALKTWLDTEGAEADIIQSIPMMQKPYPQNKLLSLQVAEEEASYFLEEDRALEIGYKGEEILYEYLQEKYPNETVNWHNQTEESRLPYDFTVEKDEEILYIEAKSSTAERTNDYPITFSTTEWSFLIEHSTHYEVYRLFNIDNDPQIELLDISSAVQVKLKNGQVVFISKSRDEA